MKLNEKERELKEIETRTMTMRETKLMNPIFPNAFSMKGFFHFSSPSGNDYFTL